MMGAPRNESERNQSSSDVQRLRELRMQFIGLLAAGVDENDPSSDAMTGVSVANAGVNVIKNALIDAGLMTEVRFWEGLVRYMSVERETLVQCEMECLKCQLCEGQLPVGSDECNSRRSAANLPLVKILGPDEDTYTGGNDVDGQ